MAIIGQYSTTDLLQKEFLKNLPLARNILSQFNTLNTLFSSFHNYESKEYEKTKNIILRLCLPDIYGNIGTRRQKLAEIEDALLIFDVLNWSKADRDHLKDRLCNDNYYKSLTQYTELIYAKWLAEKLGKKNVEIYPKLTTGKISDVLAKLDTKSIYLEIGNLSESCPERKIQKILDEAALHLGTKVKDPIIMLLEVDTSELLVFDSKGHIDEKASIEKITSEIDRLCIDKIDKYYGAIFLDDIAFAVNNKILLGQLGSLVLPSTKKNLEFIDTPAISNWISLCKTEIAKGSKLVKWFSRHMSTFLLVEVHPMMAYPSKAALSERDSFIYHVIRHIKNQLKQLQPDSPNVIVVQGFNWVLFGLGEDFEDIEPLSSKIREYLSKNQQKHLSGIDIFTNDFAKSVFIPNEQAAKESKLSNDDIEKLGMRIVSQSA